MRGATFTFSPLLRYVAISIHAPHAGSDRVLDITMRAASGISIHAPHAGSDTPTWIYCHNTTNFNPRSPCGERRICYMVSKCKFQFQSTLPMRGATTSKCPKRHKGGFQSTLPMRGATKIRGLSEFTRAISIHAPHAGSDTDCFSTARPKQRFQSTLPMRGATNALELIATIKLISIHAPHAGSDGRSPYGLRRIVAFQSTLPMRGATCCPCSGPSGPTVFQSTLPMRGATRARPESYVAAGFQSTLPMRGATDFH